MENEFTELDQLQADYKTLVDQWVSAIREEEALASTIHDVAEIDKWEQAFFRQDDLREQVKVAKEKYEDGLRAKFFQF